MRMIGITNAPRLILIKRFIHNLKLYFCRLAKRTSLSAVVLLKKRFSTGQIFRLGFLRAYKKHLKNKLLSNLKGLSFRWAFFLLRGYAKFHTIFIGKDKLLCFSTALIWLCVSAHSDEEINSRWGWYLSPFYSCFLLSLETNKLLLFLHASSLWGNFYIGPKTPFI